MKTATSFERGDFSGLTVKNDNEFIVTNSKVTSSRILDRGNIVLDHQNNEIHLEEKVRSMVDEYYFGQSKVIPTLYFSRNKGNKSDVTQYKSLGRNSRVMQNRVSLN